MNQTPLSIVTFGVDQNTARWVKNRLCAKGINAESYVITNTQDRPWFERILEMIKKANPNLPIIHHQGADDLENAIERHFKIQLPPTQNSNNT